MRYEIPGQILCNNPRHPCLIRETIVQESKCSSIPPYSHTRNPERVIGVFLCASSVFTFLMYGLALT